jgi:hypothetical protein
MALSYFDWLDLNRTITLILSDQFQRIWEKAVTGNRGKFCNGDFVISDFDVDKITEYEVFWICSMQEAHNKRVQYTRKKFVM